VTVSPSRLGNYKIVDTGSKLIAEAGIDFTLRRCAGQARRRASCNLGE
jgi:hypothetical protein